MLGFFFKEVLYAVFLFGLEIWVMTPHVGRALGGGSSQGVQTDYREASLGAPGWKLGVPYIGGGYSGGRV